MSTACDGTETPAPHRHPPAETPRDRWYAVGALALSTFLVVTSEMLPVGVLTPMADELGVSTGTAGASLTVTGLLSAVVAPITPRILGDADRRRILAAAMLALAAGNLVTTFAVDAWTLMSGRVVVGVGMGVVWGLASAVAARLVAPRHVARAVSVVVAGVAGASVLGVPIGTAIGNAFGWRTAFGVLTAAAAGSAAVLLRSLPPVRRPEPESDTDAGGAGHLLRPSVVTGLVLIVLLVVGHFTAYTFVRPLLEDRAGMSATAVALLLLLYGILGLLGNFVAGAAAARRPHATMVTLAAGIAVALVILAVFGGGALAAGAALALWGVAYGGVSVGGQMWMTAAAPDRLEHVTGAYVGVFTASIAFGALLGGRLYEAVSMTTLLWTAAALAAAALLVAVVGPRPSPR